MVFQRADPFIYKHTDGYYYFSASVPEYDRIEIRRSPTLAGLDSAEPYIAWHCHKAGEMSHLIWAPEIHYLHGKWYIYFAAAPNDEVTGITFNHRMFVIENSDENPLTPNWVEKGQIKTGLETFSLDATAFEYKVFLTYSASATDENYCIGMLTANEGSDLLDPASWTKEPKPVFVTSYENHIYGPGHSCFTKSEDDSEDLLVYHARNYTEITGDPLYDPNRHTRVQSIRWQANGFPDLGHPVAETRQMERK